MSDNTILDFQRADRGGLYSIYVLAIEQRDTARTDLASCEETLRERDEQLRLARMALARAAELLGDSAKPFDEACTIIRAQLPSL